MRVFFEFKAAAIDARLNQQKNQPKQSHPAVKYFIAPRPKYEWKVYDDKEFHLE